MTCRELLKTMLFRLRCEMDTELTKLRIAVNKSRLEIITLQEKVSKLEGKLKEGQYERNTLGEVHS